MNYDGPAIADALARARHRIERDEALLRQALEALAYAADVTEPQGDPCVCPICAASDALEKRLGEKV
jgi:hypothetical protein